MSEEDRNTLLSTKIWEIVVSEEDLKSGGEVKGSVLEQIARIIYYIPQIRKLMITIHIPSEYITNNAAFAKSPAREFLEKLVKELGVCQALVWMSVILVLPESVPATAMSRKQSYKGFPLQYLYPFFCLELKAWCVKIKREGEVMKDVREKLVEFISRRYDNFDL